MKPKNIFCLALIFLPFMAIFLAVAFWVVLLVFHSQTGVEYESPANPANKIFFSCSDTDEQALFAKPKHGKTQFAARLEEDGAYRLGDFQWTKDGQAVVCSLMLLGEITTNDYAPLSPVIAYDFSTGKATVPSWFGFDSTGAKYKESNWRAFEPTVGKIITLHGGLSDKRVDFYMVHDHEKMLWFWQIPKVPLGM